VKRSILIVVAVMGLIFSTPAFAQRSHPAGRGRWHRLRRV